MEPVLASSVLNAERSQLSGWHAVVCFALLCFALLCFALEVPGVCRDPLLGFC